jgi:hypothetical protein
MTRVTFVLPVADLRFGRILAAPVAGLKALQRRADIPWAAWLGFVLLAFAGTALFGAGQGSWTEAGRLVFGAGGAWMVLIPALWIATRLAFPVLLQACLVTMAYGELVLLTGVVMPRFPGGPETWVLISNLIMAAALTVLLGKLGVPRTKTLALWMVFLNGTGTVLYFFVWPEVIR